MFEYFLFSGSSRETLQLHIFLEVSQNPIRLWGWTPQEGNPYSYSVWIFYGFVRPSLTSLTNPTVTRGFAREQWQKSSWKQGLFRSTMLPNWHTTTSGRKNCSKKSMQGRASQTAHEVLITILPVSSSRGTKNTVWRPVSPRAGGKTHGWKPKITGGFGLMVSP